MNSVEQVKALFSADLEEMLTFEDSGDYIVIRTRQYLGSENFAKISSIVRQVNGEWVSAGQQSHFKVPKATTAPNRDSVVSDISFALEQVIVSAEQFLVQAKKAKKRLEEVE